MEVAGKNASWSSIAIEAPGTSLVLNRLVRVRPGDRFSSLVLGVHNYFNQVKTKRKAIKADVLRRVERMALAIGVVAKPEFVELAGHYDCIFRLAKAFDAIIWTGSGVINADGDLLLDGEGNTELGG